MLIRRQGFNRNVLKFVAGLVCCLGLWLWYILKNSLVFLGYWVIIYEVTYVRVTGIVV